MLNFKSGPFVSASRRESVNSGVRVLLGRRRSAKGCHPMTILTGMLLLVPTAFSQQAARIDSIIPAAARHGEPVTIEGIGFGAQNVDVTVAGIATQVVAVTGSQVTFRVPDAVAPGVTNVSAAKHF